MNKHQRAILIEIVTIIAVTIIAIVAMLNLRHYVNQQEAKAAMTTLGNRIRQYRAENGLVPPENWVDRQRETVPGNVRLGELRYRARWIDFESDPNEILAYAEQKFNSFIFKDGFFVLRLKAVIQRELTTDVNIEWMEPEEFEATLAQQQSPMEIEMQGE